MMKITLGHVGKAAMLAVAAVACIPSGGGGQDPGDDVTYPVLQTTGPKKRVGVVEFANNATRGGARLAKNASDAMTEFLVKSKAFIVFERDRLSQVMKEQGLSMSGAISSETAVKAGEIMGLNAIIVGQVEDYDEKIDRTNIFGIWQVKRTARALVRVRIIDTTTGQILLADSGEGLKTEDGGGIGYTGSVSYDENLGKKALNQALAKLINNIFASMEKQAWTGRVAAIEAGKVYINAGMTMGLTLQDRFEVREAGKMIKDPVTKMAIGYTKGNKKGELQPVDVQGEMTVCISARGSASDLKVNDQVYLVPRPVVTPARANGGGQP